MRSHHKIVLGSVAAIAASVPLAHAADSRSLQPSGTFSVPASKAAATPPMGWNPWNAFRTEVTEDKIMAVAQALQSTGLAAAGYRYVNIDDGWWLRRRSDGRIEIRTSMFPSAALANGETSFRPFVDRLHRMGLRAGIYTDIGRNACSQAWDARSPNLPVGTMREREVGSFGFQAGDMRQIFGDWGFDYIKVDACGLADFTDAKPYVRDGAYRALGPYIVRGKPDESQTEAVHGLYADLRRAIASVRPDGDYVLSICTWGEAKVADWGRLEGGMWRTSPDIRPTWASMLRNFDSAAARPLYAGPGHWNDPDMLEIGHGEFDQNHLAEARAHMSLWAIISAPLILGADLTRLPQSLVDIAANREVIAIDQDPAGNQGVVIAKDADTEVIVKSMARRGLKAVALVNRGAKPRQVSVALARMNLDPALPAKVRDAWTGKERVVENAIAASLAPHEASLLLVEGQPELRDGVYLGEMPARVNVAVDGRAGAGQALASPVQVNATPSGEALVLGGKRYDNGLGVLPDSRLEVRLDGQFSRLRAIAGSVGAAAPMSFRVYGDGKLLFEKTTKEPVPVEVPVKGVTVMELVAQAASASDSTAAWADARLAY